MLLRHRYADPRRAYRGQHEHRRDHDRGRRRHARIPPAGRGARIGARWSIGVLSCVFLRRLPHAATGRPGEAPLRLWLLTPMAQAVFFFGNGTAEGTRDSTSVLGGKGANLAEMTNLGVPVPAGFTIACSECIEYLRSGKYSDKLRAEVEGNIARLEKATGKKLGDPNNPLLVSVRSGAPVSMPGMMDTILNLGLNDRAVTALAEQSQNARFAYDSYRRFIQMYSDVVLGVSIHDFEHLLKA